MNINKMYIKLANTKNYGFSLIELSIVLIIIGLLVAGITGGASLIKSAETRSLINDVQNLKNAINTYYVDKGMLPSKAPYENSLLRSCASFKELYDNEILSGSIDSCAEFEGHAIKTKARGKSLTVAENIEMAKHAIFIVASSQDFTDVNEGIIPYMAFTPNKLGNIPSGSYVTTKSKILPALTRKEAKNLDSKLDDGIIDSGKVRSFDTNSAQPCAYDDTNALDCITAFAIDLGSPSGYFSGNSK